MLRAERFPHAEPALRVTRAAASLFPYETASKRVLDVALAVIGLVATLPLWIAIVVAIRLDSPGTAIFVQDRVGLRGRRFRFYKFRSMYTDAETRLEELRTSNEASGPVFKMRSDPRITRVGALLRRTSLDELPQLINVLKGDMSMVGPRPPLPKEVEQYRPSDAVRLTVKPGLTCLWQVSGRSTIGFDEWMELDRRYIRGMSFRLDLSILLRTAWAVLSCKGAF
ncbi:MAG TPA: sugar transferase [Candidatus Dormibacteraeota bacterium]|nr:sugar transferase [Candidatus Dormibacteraeota bacterium]